MRAVTWSVAGIAAFGAVAVYFPREEAVTPQKPNLARIQSHLEARVRQLDERVEAVAQDLGFESPRSSTGLIKITRNPDEYGSEHVPFFDVVEGTDRKFEYLQADGAFMGFCDYAQWNRFRGDAAEKFLHPPPRFWDKTQVASIANKFLSTIKGDVKITLGSAVVKFQEQKENDQYFVGHWDVYWPRVDRGGRVFENDRARMVLVDGKGLVSIGITQSADYDEASGVEMNAKMALKYARSTINFGGFWENFSSTLLGQGRSSWVESDPYLTYLEIVQPGHDPHARSRLAWVFWFHEHYSGSHYPVSFWIDVHTGELIGGDVVLLDTPD